MVNIGAKEKEEMPDAPELFFGLGIYLEAFYLLDTERNHYFGPTSIPWSKIQYYADSNGFDSEQTCNLHFHIREMDKYEVKRVQSEQKRAKAKPGK